MIELLVLAGGIPAVIAVISAMGRRRYRAASAAAAEWSNRPQMGDGEFLAGCGIPTDPFRERVAIAVRRVIAILAEVPMGTIHPTDAFRGGLDRLPFWDSLDWGQFILETELLLQREVRILEREVFGEAIRQAGGQIDGLRVEHIVRSVAMGARPRAVGEAMA